MPELPEVEIICRGIAGHVVNQQIVKVVIRNNKLRWPIWTNLAKNLSQQTIKVINRRAKYILVTCTHGTLIIHLGMTGKLRVVASNTLATKHDHIDFLLSNGNVLRYTDPRRFGSIHWTTKMPREHKLLLHLGVEPLTIKFSGAYLFDRTREKNVNIKSLLMDQAIVVGIGNIYANEALFHAGIRPTRPAKTISLSEYTVLVKQVKFILKKAINKGGTTIKDFVNAEGKPGYFVQELMVYGRIGRFCYQCNTALQNIRLNQRSTVFCPVCQR
jgi:formamidopyrimidine-DNA glycosylase